MGYIWKITEKYEDEQKRRGMFLAVNAAVWALTAFIAALLILLFFMPPVNALLYALLSAGYGAVLVGIYGGAVFLYKND